MNNNIDSQAPVHLGVETFDKALASTDKPVLVDFWATWCPPCKAIAPTLDRVAREQAGEAIVAKVDVDEAQVIAAKYQISAIPTLIVFRNGKPVDRMVGLQSHAEITRRLAAAKA